VSISPESEESKMFKVDQRVLFTEAATCHEAGLPGVVDEIDEADDYCPYYVELTDEDGILVYE
jgi:hypothetical protein